MIAKNTKLQDCFILKPEIFEDNRGYFFESFNQKKFGNLTGQETPFVQDNQAFSMYGVVRGLHFQKGDWAQAKLVRVLRGKVLDVAVDLRPDSPTYGKWDAIELSDKNFLQLYVPRGFAHGYSVLEDNTILAYKCDNFYNKENEGGIRFNDPGLDIDWQIPEKDRTISKKDGLLPFL